MMELWKSYISSIFSAIFKKLVKGQSDSLQSEINWNSVNKPLLLDVTLV